MSWIFGEIIKNKSSVSDISKIVNEQFIHSYIQNDIKIYSGGNSKNLHFIKISNQSIFVAGIGIQNSDGINKLMATKEWEISLKKGIDETLKLDGHFVIIVLDSNRIELYTDKLGLRDIYIQEFSDRIVFTTKIKWLTYFSNLAIDYSEFSSRWLLFNQISQESIFKNIKRLVAGNNSVINLKENFKVSYTNSKYEFSKNNINSLEYESSLTSLVNLRIPTSEKLSLSLSGGMDSRVILAILLNRRTEYFDTHTFGDSKHPDSIIARQIISKYKIDHFQFDSNELDVHKLICELKEYTTETLVNNAASSILQLRNYDFLINKNLVVIDGGFGEIWRREFFYKLLIKGKKALLNKNANEIIPNLSLPRADIFNNDIIDLMTKGSKKQLERIFELLPQINDNNIENWLDQFGLITRLPNYYSHEQTRLDDKITSVMPFVQQSLIKYLFSIKINEKRNGRLYRKIIKHNFSELKNFNLVKGTTSHPYFLNSFQSRLWAIIAKRFNRNINYKDNTYILLDAMKEFIFDSINSKVVLESNIFERNKIQNLVEGYYKEKTNAHELDWFLSFLIFTEAISERKNL